MLAFFREQNDRENHGGDADDSSADENRFGGGLEGVARGVVGFKIVFALLEVGHEAKIALNFFLDAWDVLRLSQLKHRLGIVGLPDRSYRQQC